ncbi:MAG: sigma-70 family RNA polymerase sigma factor [Planctomycetota bacterium]
MSQTHETQPTDEVLIERIARRDERAFAAFYDRHAPRVYGLLLKILKTESDAEDTLQETFWQVWERSDQYDADRAAPCVWLIMRARSRAIDLLRRRRATLPNSGLAAENVASAAPVACAVDASETRQQLAGCLVQLPDDQAIPIHLAFFEGLTHTEIAARLALPLGTIKTRIRGGIQRLKSLVTPPASAAPKKLSTRGSTQQPEGAP